MTPEEREKERVLFEAERQRVPHLFNREPMVDTEKFLKLIGIEGIDAGPIGYVKLMPQDFIVEEISPNELLHTVDTGPLFDSNLGDGPTIYADLVKIGISTLDAKEQLAEIFDIDQKYIGFAGIKDRLALTAQPISIRDVFDIEKFQNINADNFFLKNIHRGKGVIDNGNLWGNRFIITLRTQELFSKERMEKINRKVAEIKQDGFWNFFHFQRFGTPRLISHLLGLLLVKNQYQEAVKTFLTFTAPRELPYFKNIRQEIEKMWGNWSEIKKKIENFPYHFHLELKLINHLIENPDDFLGALHTIPDQIRLWTYAYDCFLFNRKLSELIRQGEVPLKLPLITSFNPHDWEPYQKFLEADEVKLPSRSYKDFPFIRIQSRAWPTIQKIKIHEVVFQERLAVFAFSLPKGSYATTFLMNFFTLSSGLPIVPGVTTEKIDAKSVVNLGSLTEVLERFKTVLEKREQDILGGIKK